MNRERYPSEKICALRNTGSFEMNFILLISRLLLLDPILSNNPELLNQEQMIYLQHCQQCCSESLENKIFYPYHSINMNSQELINYDFLEDVKCTLQNIKRVGVSYLMDL